MVSKRERWFAEIPAELSDWVANRLVHAHLRILGAVILGHLLNTVVIVAVYYGTAPLSWLAFGFVSMAAACAHRMWIGRGKAKQAIRANPQNMIWRLETNTILLGALAAASLIFLLPLGSATQQIVLAIAGTTWIAAAGYTMRTLPKAAIAYMCIISAGLIVGILRTASFNGIAAGFLVGSTTVLLCRMALNANKLFITRILNERELNESAATVKMLLENFEDHGSDWLFELDENGRILGASNRFGEALQLPVECVNGTPFLDLFEQGAERSLLADHLSHGRGFRNQNVPLRISENGEARWWSISAKALKQGYNGEKRVRGVISDISAERQAVARVHHLAHFDGLTALPNRIMFTGALERMFSLGGISQSRVLMIVNIDQFKLVNDTLGHPVGDQFLRQTGDRIVACVRECGLGGEGLIIARLGGDEFALLTSGEDVVDHSTRLAELLLTALSQPVAVNGHMLESSASIGIAIAPLDGDTGEALLRNAGLAVATAKSNGRGCWERFELGMDVAVRERHALERDLRAALSKHELQLFYQPLVEVDTGKPTGYEALIRWQNGERGLVMPDNFIPLAEETGLIIPIGEWVIRTAMAAAASWDEPRTVAVNVSPIQMRSPNLLPTIINALAETGIDPARFEIEITEGVLLNDSEANMAVLHKIRALGIRVALDDFGTGYSSLNYLRTFPFDKIKIDRSFVRDLESREDCRAIVSAVIGLARSLGMVTLAEGVEDAAQLEQLRGEGCSMAQGWLFGKAMPVEYYQPECESIILASRAA